MNRRRTRSVFVLFVGCSFSFWTSWVRAHEDGAEPGRSGGPAGSSAHCTECHTFNEGHGSVQLLGAPKRYRAGAVYDLIARIRDADRVGAGFEISVETPSGHAGALVLSDPARTRYAASQPEYVTHSLAGLEDSIAHWSDQSAAGFDFAVRWMAPSVDVGNVTFFLAGQAVDDSGSADGEHYYATHATARFALSGDADGDDDVDLHDFAALQRCFGGGVASECPFADTSGDGVVEVEDIDDFAAVATGPTAMLPSEYLDADVVRGGRLYDRWWEILGLAAPTGRHPLYPASSLQNGSTTYRCKECHGWDYKGKDGAYGSGSRFTGIVGIYGTTLSAQEIFELLKGDPKLVPNGHAMGSLGLADSDLWDLTKMSLAGAINTSTAIGPSGAFLGNTEFGGVGYTFACTSCHGDSGTALNFGSMQDPEFVGTIAFENPWEMLHRIRFGVPATPMAATELLGWPTSFAQDIGAYTQTLPR